MRRIAMLAVFTTLALACGGSSSNNNNAPSFNYGSPTNPSAAQQSAEASFESSLQSGFTATSDSTGNTGVGVASLPFSLAGSLFSGSGLASGPFASRSYLMLAPHAFDPACISETSTSVTYTNCTDTSGGETVTLNGSLSWTSSSATWDLKATGTGSNGSATFEAKGSFTIGSTTFVGSATYHLTGSANGQSVDVTLGMNLNLTFTESPFCITGGDAEFTLVWTTPAPTASQPDRAVKFTWPGGCGNYQIQVAQSP